MKICIMFVVVLLGCMLISGCYSMPDNMDYWKADIERLDP